MSRSFIRLRLREGDSILPWLGTCRTGDCHASIGQRLSGGRAVYGTTLLEEVEVTPEVEDKCCFVVAMLGD